MESSPEQSKTPRRDWRDYLLVAVQFLLLVLFYGKSHYEEGQLGRAYPGYNHYRKRTGRFLPRLPRR